MNKRRIVRAVGAITAGLLVSAAAGCTGDDGPPEAGPSRSVAPDPEELARTDGLYHGTYVGRAQRTRALVAVSALPPDQDGDREVTVFVTDGSTVFEHFAPVEASNDFEAESVDGDARARGEVTAETVTGVLTTRSGRFRFRLERATGAAGLYELDETSRGRLTGASPAGVGATGSLNGPTRGHLDLADGRRLRFSVAKTPRRALPDRQARVIVLPGGQVAGVLPGAGAAIHS
jgi:hypothetical protein